MEPLCQLCGVVRAVVYCKQDSARLCLRCDSCVHSANYLARRHSRSLICDKCNSQPAIVRCMDEKISLCQSCDWSNGNGCSGLGHSRQTLSCYSGCPSLAEFSRIWASVLDVPPSSSVGGGVCGGWGPMTSALPMNEIVGNENSVGLVASKLNELENRCAKFEPWIGPSSLITPNLNFLPQYSKDQTGLFPEGSNLTKVISLKYCTSFCHFHGKWDRGGSDSYPLHRWNGDLRLMNIDKLP